MDFFKFIRMKSHIQKLQGTHSTQSVTFYGARS
jgi:hypothetical protein